MVSMLVVAGIPGFLAILIFGWACILLIHGLIRGNYARGRR